MVAQPTVLLVDDSPEDRATYRRYLEGERSVAYNVVEIETGAEALTWCQRQVPDILLIDFLLPDIDGLQVMQKLHRQVKGIEKTGAIAPPIPTIFLTGQGDVEIAVRVMSCGAMDYLLKGKLTAKSLRRSLRNVLKRVQFNQLIARQQQQQLLAVKVARTTMESVRIRRENERRQEQQRLVAAIALRIRQFLHLKDILNATVAEVREFLTADRVVVYQFEQDMSGRIVAESVMPQWMPSINEQITDTCFQENAGGAYRQGKVRAINNIYEAGLTDCHLQLLERFQVKANLVVPILLDSRYGSLEKRACCSENTSENPEGTCLWGLLIAHQCEAARQWEANEINLLNELAVQLAIAIQQANLYRDLQTLNAQLETKVEQRTAALQESETKFRTIFETVQDATIIADMNDRIVDVNPAACEMYGYTHEEFVGLHGWQIVHPDARDQLDAFLQAIQTRQTFHTVSKDIRKDGTSFDVEVHSTVFCLQEECFTLTTVRDVSERLRAERALEQVNQELERRVNERTQQLQETNRSLLQEVSDRKQAEQALATSQRLLQQVVETSPSLVYVFDLTEARAIYTNRNTSVVLGYAPDEVTAMGTDFTQRVMHPEDFARFPHHIQRLKEAADGEILEFEYRMRHADGSWQYYHSFDTVFARSETGEVTQIIGNALNVSDRLRTEAALRESEITNRALIRAIPDLLMHIRQDGTYLAVHANSHARMFGDEKLVPGANICDVLPAEIACDRLHRIQKVASTNEPDIYEYQLNVEGETVYQEARIFPCSEDTVLVMVRDVSARKKAVQALQESEEKFRQLAENISDVFWIVGIGMTERVYVSPSFEQVWGHPCSILHEDPKNWITGIHPEDLDRVMQAVPKQILGEYDIEYRIIRPDGSLRWIRDRAFPVKNEQGEVYRMAGIAEDITDRKQFEEALRHSNAELSRATQLKDEFLANMSHELRTPLNAILGLSEGMLDGMGGELDERQRKAIATIERSGRHLLELINDILDLSKIEAGKLELDISPTSIARLCEGSLTFVRQMAMSKHIQLGSSIPDNLCSVDVDERRIRQALINLLSNAVKFTPEHGSVTLGVSLQAHEGDPRRFWIAFAVTDTGIGISVENQAKLFQPFTQVDSSLSRKYEGTGLGLSLVRRIAELHGGYVSVQSELGKGSCFTMRLPAQFSEGQVAIADEEFSYPDLGNRPGLNPSSNQTLILLAEDNEANIQLLTSFLESKGYRFEVARNGLEAFKKAKQCRPDLILMDVQMPLVDGLEATARIRGEASLAGVPIIALTALAMPGDRDRCLKAGATEYLTKPVHLKQLEQMLHKLLEPITNFTQ